MASLFANSCAILLCQCITFADKPIVAAPKTVSGFFRIYNKKVIGGSFPAAAYTLRNKF